jgi:hypothetical protein
MCNIFWISSVSVTLCIPLLSHWQPQPNSVPFVLKSHDFFYYFQTLIPYMNLNGIFDFLRYLTFHLIISSFHFSANGIISLFFMNE